MLFCLFNSFRTMLLVIQNKLVLTRQTRERSLGNFRIAEDSMPSISTSLSKYRTGLNSTTNGPFINHAYAMKIPVKKKIQGQSFGKWGEAATCGASIWYRHQSKSSYSTLDPATCSSIWEEGPELALLHPCGKTRSFTLAQPKSLKPSEGWTARWETSPFLPLPVTLPFQKKTWKKISITLKFKLRIKFYKANYLMAECKRHITVQFYLSICGGLVSRFPDTIKICRCSGPLHITYVHPAQPPVYTLNHL